MRKLLNCISEDLPKEVQILVAREMTKIHETFYRGNITHVIEQLETSNYGAKGEFVLIVSGIKKTTSEDFTSEDQRIMDILYDSLPQKEALSMASKILNKKRNFLYQKMIEHK